MAVLGDGRADRDRVRPGRFPGLPGCRLTFPSSPSLRYLRASAGGQSWWAGSCPLGCGSRVQPPRRGEACWMEVELPWISPASLGKAEEQGREAPSSDLPCSDPPVPVLTKPKRTPTKEKCLQGPAQVLQRRAKCRRRTERQLIHTWHVFVKYQVILRRNGCIIFSSYIENQLPSHLFIYFVDYVHVSFTFK